MASVGAGGVPAAVAPTVPAELAGAGAGTARTRRGLHGRRRRRLNIFRYIAFTVFGVFFVLPLLALLRMSFEPAAGEGGWSLAAWKQIVSYSVVGTPSLISRVVVTLELGALTAAAVLVLLVPTMIWIKLKVPWISRTVEFLCLLPLTIPAIVLVVGLVPVYNWIAQRNISTLMLFWVYVVLVLPYAYRALAAGLNSVDVKTLSEAARGLGASWFTVMFRIIAPNMRQGILNASLLAFSLVLGEFPIAYLLLYVNLQVELYSISRNTPNASVLFSTSFAALVFTFLLLLILSYVGRPRRGRR
ncbi:MAG TPA: ABC transporter permease subunit [Streptosporangiaceae bacterium]|jgi:putative spermidine/putrescine transport system permease protein|nr:ABC transporter permease subunit [Streptosporangiaceae bacterium]